MGSKEEMLRILSVILDTDFKSKLVEEITEEKLEVCLHKDVNKIINEFKKR